MLPNNFARTILLYLISHASVAFSAPPANDHFADRTVIPESSLPVRIPFNNVEATTEANEPGNPEFQKASVWYSVTLSGGSAYQIDTYFSDKDFELEMYTGTAIGALTLEDSDDEDDCSDFACGSTVIVRPPVDTTYQIRVVSPVFESGVQSGTGNININRFTPTANHDNFADAVTVGLGGSDRVDYLDDAASITYEPGEPQPVFGATGSLWFKFTPPESAAYTFAGNPYIYEGSAVDSLIEVGMGRLRSGTVVELTGGQTYYLAVYPFGSFPQSLIVEGPLVPAQPAGSAPINLGSIQSYEADIALREGDGRGEDFFWFEKWHWTPDSDGVVAIAVEGILSNPTTFTIHEGATDNVLNLIEEIQGKGTLEIAVTEGQIYTLVGIVEIDEEFVASGSLSIDLDYTPDDGGNALAPFNAHLFNSGGSLTLVWTPDPNTAAGTRYEVQFSGDLGDQWTPVASNIAGNSFDIGAVVSPRGFYRIVASTP